MSKYIMALDQGTTSSRCIIYDKKGNMMSVAQKEFTQIYPKAGWVMVGITVLICVGRVLTGVHHICDVVGGAALGFALGFGFDPGRITI